VLLTKHYSMLKEDAIIKIRYTIIEIEECMLSQQQQPQGVRDDLPVKTVANGWFWVVTDHWSAS
jgi:hypothetical protein